MGFIKNLFKNDGTTIGLCELRKKQIEETKYETKGYILNTLFREPVDNNFLLKNI